MVQIYTGLTIIKAIKYYDYGFQVYSYKQKLTPPRGEVSEY